MEVIGSKTLAEHTLAEPKERGLASPSLSFLICEMDESGHHAAPQSRPGEAVIMSKG